MLFMLGQEEAMRNVLSPGAMVFTFWEWEGNCATLGERTHSTEAYVENSLHGHNWWTPGKFLIKTAWKQMCEN